MHPVDTNSSSSSTNNNSSHHHLSHEEEEVDAQGLFPHRLRSLLNDDDTGIAEWFEDGSGFRICNKIDFVNHLLPKYFRCKKIRSFSSPILKESLSFRHEVSLLHKAVKCLWLQTSS